MGVTTNKIGKIKMYGKMGRNENRKNGRKAAGVAIAVLLLLFMAAAAVPTASAGWDYYRVIEIDNGKVSGGANLESFPVLINLSEDWLKYEDALGHVRQANGYDIVFTDSDNANKLDFEIEEYDSTAGTLVAWVRIPALDYNDNTSIRLYYGNSQATDWSNPTGVWDSNYKGVWHLNETTGGAGAIKDSTSNDNDGTDYGSPNLDVTGQIDGADAFDGTDDYLSAGTTNFEMQQGTYEAWVNFDNWANNQNDVLFSAPSEAAATSADLVGYWRFDELEGGNTVADISGHGNNGTIYGTGGIAESGTVDTLTDTNQSWATDEWKDETIYITAGTGSGQERIVASNTATVITVTSEWGTNPDATSEYAVTPGTEFTAAGRFGGALGFDGTEGYIDCGNDSSLDITDAITIETWMKTTNPLKAGVADKLQSSTPYNGYTFCIKGAASTDEGKPSFYTPNTGWVQANTRVDDGNWHHIVVTGSGSNGYFYLDGNQDGTFTFNTISIASEINLKIGRSYVDNPFNGTIDEVRIYDAAISEDRIRGRYLGAISAHKNAGNNLVMHLGPATMTTSVSGLSGWHHVAGTWDNTAPGKAYLFLDGVQKAEASFWGGTRRIFGDYSYFANDENNQMQSAGKMDEFRVSASARSGDWINTSHNNQNSPSTFYLVADTATSTGGTDPVPELPTIILFAVGLVVLVGYQRLERRRRRGKY